jgi:glycosyltransferase involved in cell wall biosynthesis
MQIMPKVSVIIPTYNAQEYLSETLDSVLSQTYSHFEVIVVDDGSKDQTISIVEEYRMKYPEKVKLIQKENGGPASARNVGIKAAVGEYIAFIDADDLWLPEKLEKQVRYFESQPLQVGLVYTNTKKFDKDGVWTLPGKYCKKHVNGWIYKDLIRDNVIHNLSVMARKRCFDVVGFLDESIEINEDYDMWLRIAMRFKISFIDEVLALYREHPQGRSKELEKTWIRAIGVYDKHLKMAADNDELEDTVKGTFSQHLYKFGYAYLREGKMLKARNMFEKSLNMRFLLKVYMMKLVTFIPFKVLNLFNKLFKSIFKPPKIVKSKYMLKSS